MGAAKAREQAKDEREINAALSKIERRKGETDADFAERKRQRAKELRKEKQLARAKTAREKAKRAELAAKATSTELAEQNDQLKRKDSAVNAADNTDKAQA